jgi:hypothetical protein
MTAVGRSASLWSKGAAATAVSLAAVVVAGKTRKAWSVLLSTEAAGMLSTGTTVLLADREGGADTAAGVLPAKGDATVSKMSDDGFDTAARFLDSRNLRVSFRMGISENLGNFNAWKRRNWDIENTEKIISKRKITSVQALPLLSSPDVLEQAICKKKKK